VLSRRSVARGGAPGGRGARCTARAAAGRAVRPLRFVSAAFADTRVCKGRPATRSATRQRGSGPTHGWLCSANGRRFRRTLMLPPRCVSCIRRHRH
jgi:hypothetical protein